MPQQVITEPVRKPGLATETILEALPGDRVLQSNGLATVTTNCLIVRSADRRTQTIIPIVHLCEIKTAKTTHPSLLVISAASFLIAAAAYCSKQGGGGALPSALVGGLFLLAYFAHRKAAVLFVTKSGETATGDGSMGEVSRLVKTVSSIRARKQEREAEDPSI